MAAAKKGAAMSFDDMIQADRKKRKNEELANEMLGSGRRKSGPGQAGIRKSGPGASLASRVGVNKRSSSAGPKPGINSSWVHDLYGDPALRPGRNAGFRSSPLADNARAAASQVFAGAANSLRPQAHLSIKGKANPGPYVVIASNFEEDTTAEDVKTVVEPIAGHIISCMLVARNPTVMAEIVIRDREGAENVIATFNNRKADGRLLYVYMKAGGPSPIHKLGANDTGMSIAGIAKPAPKASSGETSSPQQPSSQPVADDIDMDMDERPQPKKDEGRRIPDGPSAQQNSRARGGLSSFEGGQSRHDDSNGRGQGRRDRYDNYDRGARDDRMDYRQPQRYDGGRGYNDGYGRQGDGYQHRGRW